MITLNTLALQHVAILRALRDRPDGGWPTSAGLAATFGRDKSNFAKQMKSLEEAGLIGPSALTDGPTAEGLAQLAAIDRAEGQGGAVSDADGLPSDHVILTHADLIPDPDNARKDWDSPEAVADLQDLAESIDDRGLLQNLMVKRTDEPGVFMLDGGERRWRAIAMLIADGRWPAERPILCRLIEADDLGHRLAALAENLQRRNLNPREKAIAFDGLADALIATGVPADKVNRDIADRLGVTIEHVQQHRAFMKLDEADQERLTLPKDDPKRLTVRDARQKLAGQAKAEEAARLDVSPVARLVMAELHHAISTRAHYTYADIEVAATAADDPYIAELVDAGQVTAPRLQHHGDKAGRWTIRLSHSVSFAPFPWASHTGDDLNAGLRAEQEAAAQAAGTTLPDLDPDSPYTTAWLNGPFEVTPEGQAIIDEIETAQRDRERENQERAERAEAVRAATAAAVQRSRDLFSAHRAAPPAPQDVVEVATAGEAPLPWQITADGAVIAADGSPVMSPVTQGDRAEALRRLIVLAVNTAGDLETPEDAADPNGGLTRDGFITAMVAVFAECEREDGTTEHATKILDDFLTGNGLSFGDANAAWTPDAARELVFDWIDNEAADQTEPEAA